MRTFAKNRVTYPQIPQSINLKLMFDSSQTRSLSGISYSDNVHSLTTKRWKVNESPPMLKRPSPLKHNNQSDHNLTYTLPAGNDEQAIEQHDTSKNINKSILTPSYTKCRFTSQYQKRSKSSLDSQTQITTFMRQVLKNDEYPKLVVPKIWKALKVRRSIKQRRSILNISQISVKNFLLPFSK